MLSPVPVDILAFAVPVATANPGSTRAELRKGPYVAETCPVHVEDGYVIVEV
ncbi:hypothetical protein [Bradyrhizobium sp. AS23.2]|uniref:hypothetical protein n=1 Tax=Bradyrhizobium sp. AS23.2 TaxID=1680155 RepID=UPI001FDA8264|nr:hypothetical protein [Bradyrhizobium sp. AS23.2]